MESSARGIYLRVTVPLTNLHRDLDFVGTFFFFHDPSRCVSAAGGRVARVFIERAKGNLSERSVSSLASNFNYFISF